MVGPRQSSGFSLVELTVTVAIFGVFLLILTGLATQMARFDRAFRLELMTHPQTMAVLSRVQRDVHASVAYPSSHGEFEQNPRTLLLTLPGESGGAVTVIYDFSGDTEVRRLAFQGGISLPEWIARGTGSYEISSYEMPDERVAVRLRGRDREGRLAVDQIYQPHPHF
ncbi:MAG TPA: prepilin-type N-terminal cleavage/methylation domain-containing protein [Thermoanaerobaculia bacterium]|nr:prepilin-type N-terminal cleavage/methylation domain-containing protein [Thermoanaerobaculia bacterium]